MTDFVNIGRLQLDESFFILNRDRPSPAPFPAETIEPPGSYAHCFTLPGAFSTIKEAVLNLVERARTKIFIASFRIGEPDLLDALYRSAERLRGGVYVITALDEASLSKGLGLTEEDDGFDVQAQNKQFSEMTRRGIYVRGHETCHAKFIVADDRHAVVSSANLETRGLTVTGENGVVINSADEAGRLARFFARLWFEGCTWEIPPGRVYTVRRRNPTAVRFEVPAAGNGARSGIIWTNGQEHGIRETLHEVIGLARERLLLSTFSLNGMTERPEILLAPLEKALKKNNVKADLILRARNGFSSHRRDARTLADMGVEIHADSTIHAKGIIADETAGALFSANLDAQHGLTSGTEVGVRLDGTPTLRSALAFFRHVMRSATARFVNRPTQLEMHDGFAAHWNKRWPIELSIRVSCRDGEWDSFLQSTIAGPVLFEQVEQSIRLYAGSEAWRLVPGGAPQAFRLDRDETRPAGHVSSMRILDHWLRQPYEKSKSCYRGFCPAVIEKSP